MQCAESLRVQAYFDGEVDAVSAVQIETHIEHCAECRALLQDLEQLRAALRRDVAYVRTPPPLRGRVMDALDQESSVKTVPNTGAAARRRRTFWAGACSGIGGTAAAASLAFFLAMPPRVNPILDDLVSAHLRSLMPSHLIDVVSTDRHTVKPWFAGHADVSPVVADFEPQGYRLIGGRADYFDRQRAAVVVYQHGAHTMNVFAWAADPRRSLPGNTTRNGYHLAFWQAGDLAYCVVSDAGWDEVLGLTRLLRDLSAHDNPKKME
jgi:anti-sigma factor RsiW